VMEKPKRGFATMTPEQRRAIAQKGGRATQAKGTAHRWDSLEAREAGRRGGLSRSAKKRAEA